MVSTVVEVTEEGEAREAGEDGDGAGGEAERRIMTSRGARNAHIVCLRL